MKITNKYDLPETFVNFVETNQRKPVDGEISITDLINPPLVLYLKKKYWDEIETDISEYLWMLLGSAVHMVVEKFAPVEGLSEEKIKIDIEGIVLKGVPDLWCDNKIEDYKVTSVYSFLLGDKIEWERQLNCYAYLYEKIGFKVNKLFINAILRDWMKSKAEKDYPPIPFIRKEIPLWSLAEREEYIYNRIKLFKEFSEDNLTECNNEEKWKRGGEWALMDKGKKRAIKLFKTEDEFKNVQLPENLYIQKRPVTFAKCQDYCIVRNFCKYKEVQNE